MLSSLRNMFRVADLRNKILFTLAIIAIYRLGSYVPAPGIDLDQIEQLKRQSEESGGVLAYLQLFSGAGLTNFAIFALGVMPYITSSIIMQILTVVIPKLEEWQQQGAVGQRKITQWTRYLTIAIAVLQSTALAFLFHNGGGGLLGGASNPTNVDVLPNFTAPRVILVVLVLTAGTALLMWMGETITQRGIGNGMSLLIFASVVSSIPSQFGQIKATRGWGLLIPLIFLFLVLLVGIVIVENGQRRIPVQFAKRVVGRRMYGGQSTYIPLKVNQSGVVPIIFASSMLYLPLLITQVLPSDPGSWGVGVQRWVNDNLVQPDSFFYIRRLRPADRRLRVLLHGHRLRPPPAGRHHPQAGRVHPRHPAGPADRALPGQDPGPDHAAGRAVHRRHRPAAVAAAGVRRTCRRSRSVARRSSSPWAWPSRR